MQQLCRLSFAVTESHQQILNIALPTQVRVLLKLDALIWGM